MEGEGEVLYSTVLQDNDCPVPANYYQAGPMYNIKCVQGELSQLRLPHCETSIGELAILWKIIDTEYFELYKVQTFKKNPD